MGYNVADRTARCGVLPCDFWLHRSFRLCRTDARESAELFITDSGDNILIQIWIVFLAGWANTPRVTQVLEMERISMLSAPATFVDATYASPVLSKGSASLRSHRVIDWLCGTYV